MFNTAQAGKESMAQQHNAERPSDVQTDSTMNVPVRDASEASKIPATSGIGEPSEPAMVPAATDPASVSEKIFSPIDVPDDSSPTPPTHSVPALLNDVMVNKVESAVEFLARMIGRLVIDQYKSVYVAVRGNGNLALLKLGSSEFDGRVVQLFRACGQRMNKRQLAEFTEELRAEAEVSGLRTDVWRRVAPLAVGGVVIALHDEQNTHIQIRPGQVEVLTKDSEILFYRSPSSAAMVMPAANGNYKLLRKYLNLDAVGFTLYIAWVTYTLAHPKVKGSNFVILVFIGGEGTGKSHLTKVTIRLVDPNDVGVERLPANAKILAVGVLNRHLVAYDNLRSIAPAMSDALCTTATGGAVTDRKLYTDDDQHVIPLHGAILLNGIYAFIEQPDLAQRCLPLRLEPLPEGRRKSEEDLRRDLEADMPVIMRGLFDLISKVLVHLPEAEVTNPQRMIEFVRWLAAMELAIGAPVGTLQNEYAKVLNDGQLDALLDNSLGSAVIEFAATLDQGAWSGTPAELLAKLNQFKAYGVQRPPRDWPDNEIALSKRLAPLQTALMTQGVSVLFKRGKNRKIDITNLGDRHV